MNCEKCVHRINIPGNCHIGCNNKKATPAQRFWRGCGSWPLCFDEDTISECSGFSDKQEDKLSENKDPLLEIFRILGSVGR